MTKIVQVTRGRSGEDAKTLCNDADAIFSTARSDNAGGRDDCGEIIRRWMSVGLNQHHSRRLLYGPSLCLLLFKSTFQAHQAVPFDVVTWHHGKDQNFGDER